MNSQDFNTQVNPTEGPTFFNLLEKSWAALNKNIGLGIGITIAYFIAQVIFVKIPVIGLFFGFLFTPGYLLCLNSLRKNEAPDLNQFIWGLSDFNRVLQLLALNILSGVIISIGFILLIIPGIYLFVSLTFNQIIFCLDVQDAPLCMKKSMALVKNRWWYVHNLYLWLFLLNLLGLIAFGIGLLVTIPLTYLILLEVYFSLKTQAEVPLN